MGSIVRRKDWAARFDAEYARLRLQPFEWGTVDCCLVPCNLILAMTGTDPAKPFRGKYKSERGAVGRLRRFAGRYSRLNTLIAKTAEKITVELGVPEINPNFAQRGDVVLLDEALGVVSLDGRNVITCTTKGVHITPLSDAKRAWRV